MNTRILTSVLCIVFAGLSTSTWAETVPLDNLFDDPSGTNLGAAIASDTYQAEGAIGDLGVINVIDGGLGSAKIIAPGVSFNLGVNAGGSNNAVGGKPSNDTYRSSVTTPIRTTGTAGALGSTKIENGIGMHADELITFDLQQIRDAGQLSQFPSYFTSRAGVNDDTASGNLNTVLIVSGNSGNVLSGYINGEEIGVSQNAGVWTFDNAPSASLTGSAANRIAEFAVPIAAEARYLTLASTAIGNASSDHGVFADVQWDSHAVPLGNLFDDPSGSQLTAAIATDTKQAAAGAGDLGVDRVIDGGLNSDQTIAPGVTFNLSSAGGSANGAGGVPGNDTFRSASANAIQTRGLDGAAPTTFRVEDGIGLHANELITFDLDEIRDAGGDFQDAIFKARAGVNDSATSNGSVRAIAIVSDDSGNVLSGFVNGQAVSLTQTLGVWSFTGPIPGELTATADNFVDFDVLLGSDAKFLTLAITGGSNNNIGSDHGVFSGARLTFTQVVPEPSTCVIALIGLAIFGGASWRSRRIRNVVAAVSIMFVAGVTTSEAATVTLQAGAGGQPADIIEEAMLVQESGNDNFGGRANFEVGVIGNGRVRTTVMRFNVTDPSLGLYTGGNPNFSSIDSMTLTLHTLTDTSFTENLSLRVGAISDAQGDWVEGTGTGAGSPGDAGNVTYSERREGAATGWMPDTNYTRGTGDGQLGTVATYPGDNVSFSIDINPVPTEDLTDLVTRWATGNNDGVMINDFARTGFQRWIMATSEHATVAFRPQLTITYTIPEPSACVIALIGLATFGGATWRSRRNRNRSCKK